MIPCWLRKPSEEQFDRRGAMTAEIVIDDFSVQLWRNLLADREQIL
jgi:hypothetical protein